METNRMNEKEMITTIANGMISTGKYWNQCRKCMNEYEYQYDENHKPMLVYNAHYSPKALKRTWTAAQNLKDMIQLMDVETKYLVFAEIDKIRAEAQKQIKQAGTWHCPAGEVMIACNAVNDFRAEVEKAMEQQKQQADDGMTM